MPYLLDVCKASVDLAVSKNGDIPMKLRIILQSDGSLSATASPAPPLLNNDLLIASPDAVRTIYIDPKSTSPSLFTSTKTTQRSLYNDARARVGLSPLPTPQNAHNDVLLHTPTGLALETSIRNIAFRRGDVWVTPAAHSGCLPGVMRRLMLERGLFVEGDVRMDDVTPGETVLTVNGVEGCRMGKMALLPE
ncbi:hypothetical protein EIP86_005973 [Pleurotus ostreatoroseus]|nr:hypothetical protein EIP86_005973 [Pleurotus ostreatoroseus]